MEGKTGLEFYQMEVEPAVVKIDFEVTVTGTNVRVHDIDSHGAKALFFLSFDDEPPFNLVGSDPEYGSDVPTGQFYQISFSLPGEYSVTGEFIATNH